MISQTPRTSRLDAMIEVLLVSLLAFMPAVFGGLYAWSEAIAVATGVAIALLLAVRMITLGRHEIGRPSLVWLPIVLFVVIAATQLVPLPMSLLRAVSPQTATMKTQLLSDLPDAAEVLARQPISFYPVATRQDLRVVLLAVTVFAAVVTVYRDHARICRLLACVALIGGAFAVLAAVQDVTRTHEIYWRFPLGEPARSGPFANHSTYAQFMNLSVGCALALLLARLTEAPRLTIFGLAGRTWWLAAIVVLGLTTISLSLSRGGTLAIVLAGAITTVVLVAMRNLRHMAGVVVLLGLGAIALLFATGIDRVYARMLQPAMGSRPQMLRDAAEMIRTFPTVGVGLGGFEWIFPTFDRSFESSTAAYLENEYAQALSDTGPLGLAAVLLFVGVIGWRYVRALRNPDDERVGLAAAGLGYGLAAVMVHSLSDFGQHFPSNACLSALTCGLLFNLGRRRRRRGERMIAIGRAVGVAMLILVMTVGTFAVVTAVRAWRAEDHFNHAERLASALDDAGWRGSDAQYAALFDAAAAAVRAEPDNAHHRYRAAYYRWMWVASQVDEQTGRVRVNDQTVSAARRVVDELNDARASCPTYGLVYALLGQIELKFLNRPEPGYAHIESGWRLSRNDADAAFVAGQADARRGRFDDAARKFDDALRINPNVVERVIAVYLHQYNRPELAAQGIGNRYVELIRLRDELRKRPEWAELATAAELKAFDVLEVECARGDAPAWKYGMLGAFRTDQKRYVEAEKWIARAMQDEPANMHMRVRHAELLHLLGRTPEAIDEARHVYKMYPDKPETNALMKLLGIQP
jgi:tetratricopeptide (TPR) repeat protein